MKKYPKQFLISKEPLKRIDWQALTLDSGYILSFHKQLNVYANKEKTIVLLGDAWQVDPNRLSPIEEIQNIDISADIEDLKLSIYDMEKSWCGRYILIVKSYIYLDACGLLGCFYSPQYISSNLSLICELDGREIRYPKIRHQISPDFFPGTGTEYKDIKRLLPRQVFNYENKEVYIRPLLPDGIYKETNTDIITQNFISYHSCSLLNMGKYYENAVLMLALTGGRDSRVQMALLEKANIKYKTYICDYENIASEDLIISEKLSNICKKQRYVISRKLNNFSKEKYKAYKHFIGGLVADQDKIFYAYGQYQNLQKEIGRPIILLRSSVWGCANDLYEKKTNTEKVIPYKVFPIAKYNKLFYSSIEEYISLMNKDDTQTISEWNQFFWEMRSGCWLSTIELGFDMMENITSVQPMNSRLLISLLMAYDKNMRMSKKHEEFIVNTAFPRIKNIPYDYNLKKNKSFSLSKYKSRINKIYFVLKSYGLFNTIDFVKSQLCKR